MALNNPAARLHNILSLCKNKELRGTVMMEAWRQILKLSKDVEDTLVMAKIGKIYVLPSRISTEIKQFDDLDHRLYLGWKPDLAQAFQQINFGNQFLVFSDRLSDSLLINIEFCAHELAKRKPEKMVEEQDLQQLKEIAYKLYDEVLAAKLDMAISRYILDHLYMIIEAIDDYSITGAGGLENSVNAIVGTVITQSEMARATRESKFGEPFWQTVGRVALVLKLSKTLLQLGEGIGKVIGGQ